MKFRSGLGRQGMMFPPYLEDLIEEDSPVRFIDEVVDELDLSGLESSYSDEDRPAYDPAMMLKILLLAYSERVFSSRQIAKKVKRDIGYIYLAGGERPDFRTINRFRLTLAEQLRGLFRQVALIAKRMGLVSLGHIALDGSRRPAHAARGKIRNIDQLQDEIARLDEEIAGYQARCAEADLEEDERYGDSDGDSLPEGLKRAAARMLVADGYVHLRERMRQKLRDPTYQARYKKRNWMVEPIFGRLWRIFGFQRFFRMGLQAARVDFGLICMVYNILRFKSHAPVAA